MGLFLLGTLLNLKTLVHAFWDLLVFLPPSPITISFYFYFPYLG